MAYTYVNRRLDNDQIFYVGKGTRYRLNSTNCRNKYWKSTANKYGFYSEKLIDNLTDDEAFELEELVCDVIGYDNLTNIAPAGLGGVGKMGSGVKLSATRKANISNAMKKLVLDTSTGVFYSSATEAAIAYNINYRTLCAKLNGNSTNNTNLQYI